MMVIKLRVQVGPTKSISLALALALLAMTLMIALSGNQAVAGGVSCGDTITQDTKLHSDLTNCPSNGIVIGANNITLNLNGHTIDGDGELVDPCPDTETCDFGIDNTDGHRSVTIKDGTIKQFGFGVFLVEARHNRVLNIKVSKSSFIGILLYQSSRNKVKRNSAFRNGLETDQAGMVLALSNHNVVNRNDSHRNGDIGLYVESSDHNLYRRNNFSNNPEAGMFSIKGSDGNRIAYNLVENVCDGIIVSGDANLVRRNRIHRANGCGAQSGHGISFEGGQDDVFARNWIRGTRKFGMVLYGHQMVVRRNHVHGAGSDGMFVNEKSRHAVLRRNHVFGSGDDGIDVESTSTKLARNEVRRNADLGIEAVAGVIDAGRNTASGNGDPRQCTHVSCR